MSWVITIDQISSSHGASERYEFTSASTFQPVYSQR